MSQTPAPEVGAVPDGRGAVADPPDREDAGRDGGVREDALPEPAVPEPAVPEAAGPEAAAPDVVVAEGEVPEEQVAFDINDFPGGARGAIEAVLMVVDEPVTEMSLASALELPVDDVVGHLHALEADYDERQPRLHPAQRRRRLAGLQPLRLRPRGREVPARRPAGQAHPGLPGDPGGRRLPPADLPLPGQRGPRRQRRRGRSAPCSPAASIEELGAEDESGATLYGTTPYFLQRLGLGSLDDLPALAPYLPEVDVLDELAEQGRA